MTAHYTVVQYVPDPTAEERVNVGVITWDEERLVSRFLSNWRRVRAFAGEDIGFLREFAKSVTSVTSDQSCLPEMGPRLDQERLRKIIGEWNQSIQFTNSRGSLKSVERLVDDLASVFLREPHLKHRQPRSRRTAASKAAKSLLAAMEERSVDEPRRYIQRDHTVKGKWLDHQFDVALANGKLYSAAQALSFEINESDLRKEIDATLWAIDDVRKKHRTLPLAVVVLRPRSRQQEKLYEQAVTVFEGFHTEVVPESMLKVWARDQARSIKASDLANLD